MIARYALIAAAAVAALAVAGAGVQTLRLHAAVAERDKAVSERDALLGDVRAKDTVIERQDGALKALRAELQAQGDAARAAARALERAEAERAKVAADLAAAEAKDYAKPECATALDLDLGSLCPAHATGVRQRAHRVP